MNVKCLTKHISNPLYISPPPSMGEAQGGGGQNRFVPPPLHPLPQWGGEALIFEI